MTCYIDKVSRGMLQIWNSIITMYRKILTRFNKSSEYWSRIHVIYSWPVYYFRFISGENGQFSVSELQCVFLYNLSYQNRRGKIQRNRNCFRLFLNLTIPWYELCDYMYMLVMVSVSSTCYVKSIKLPYRLDIISSSCTG